MQNKTNSFLARLLILLIFITGACVGYLFWLTEKNTKKNIPQQNILQNITATVSKEKPIGEIILPKQSTTIKKTVENNSTTSQPTVVAEQAKIQINDKIFEINFSQTTTLYQAMENLVKDKQISWQTKEFTGLGTFVDAIDGVQSDKTAGKYWIYYINGQSAKIGISQYTLKSNDLINWKYAKANF